MLQYRVLTKSNAGAQPCFDLPELLRFARNGGAPTERLENNLNKIKDPASRELVQVRSLHRRESF